MYLKSSTDTHALICIADYYKIVELKGASLEMNNVQAIGSLKDLNVLFDIYTTLRDLKKLNENKI